MVLLQLLFHGILDLVRVFEVHGHHPQGVADEVDSEVILGDLGKCEKIVLSLGFSIRLSWAITPLDFMVLVKRNSRLSRSR